MDKELIVRDRIKINSTVENVWEVLTKSKYYKQWDDLPENFSEDSLRLGSIIEWEGYSRMKVTKFEVYKHLEMELYLPKVELDSTDYDISYVYSLTPLNRNTLLTIEIGDFSPLPKGKDYFDATIEFVQSSKQKIKDLSEGIIDSSI
ncbi:hypothetical protein NC796_22290 [Aliifodinibius sp. S!AR15-10]|uniref:hypothetical protein n=1 Tax=Aliifodinibius sp. S!AR15-10 TaxID=2950437 RepID=UPI0028552389|nr:hypothetical protein [Aliifodinibius sp. S!AR15-10]MDR8393900.1 hypothetical protein [Aliifodinibius sp. S!AR15-10]